MLLESKSLWKHSRVVMSSFMQSMIHSVSGLSTKTNLQSCCCFTSFTQCHVPSRLSLRLHPHMRNTLPQSTFRGVLRCGWRWTPQLASHRRRNGCGHFDSSPGQRHIHCHKTLLVNNTLCQARPAQFWSSLDLAQPHFVTDYKQARRRSYAPRQWIPVKANVLTHELVQAVGDSAGFPSVDEEQPPSNLSAASPRSIVLPGGPRCLCSGFGHSLRHQTRGSSLNASQTRIVARLGQARSDANASGEEVSMEAFSRGHEFIQAVDDLEGFRSVHKDQPPVLLLFHFVLFAALSARRCNCIPPSHAPHPALVHVRAVSPMALDALLGFAPMA